MTVFIVLLSMEGLVTSMGGYIATYYALGGDVKQAAIYSGIGGSTATVLALISLPFFGWLSGHYGKHRALFIIVLFQIFMAAVIPFVYNPAIP